jgi:hypothetical protein
LRILSAQQNKLLKNNNSYKKNNPKKVAHFQNFQLVYIESAVAEKKATTDFTKKSKTILEQTNIWTKIHKKSPRQINSEKN